VPLYYYIIICAVSDDILQSTVWQKIVKNLLNQKAFSRGKQG
jgi:hypothetical protein